MANTSPAGFIPPEELADRLARSRRWAQLSQRELADRSGVSIKTISRIETGESKHPTRPVLAQLALACGVSRDWLAGIGANGGPAASGGDNSGSSSNEWAARDSNPEPAGSMLERAA